MSCRYPPVEPHDSGLLDVGEGQQVYWEAVGTPGGKPAVSLPAGRVAVTPDGTVRSGIPIAMTLAWAYAEAHPARVTELVHVAVTTTSRRELDWLYGDVGRLFPDAWARFREGAGGFPASVSGSRLATAYDRLLSDPDPAVREQAASNWCTWEDAVVELDAGIGARSYHEDPRKAMAFARLCAHYFSHDGFLAEAELQRDAHRIAHIPTVLIHGQLDLGSPLVTAWQMAQLLPHAELHVIAGAGHSTGSGMSETVIATLDRFARG